MPSVVKPEAGRARWVSDPHRKEPTTHILIQFCRSRLTHPARGHHELLRIKSEMTAVLRAALGTPEPGGGLGRSALISYISQGRGPCAGKNHSTAGHAAAGLGIREGSLSTLRSPARTAQRRRPFQPLRIGVAKRVRAAAGPPTLPFCSVLKCLLLFADPSTDPLSARGFHGPVSGWPRVPMRRRWRA